jgi:glycosyltransferase involved in cell wall biosynthesis
MPSVDEVVLCDGGSDDATVRLAQEHGAVVVQAQRNRGAQLNAGRAAGQAAMCCGFFMRIRARIREARRASSAL